MAITKKGNPESPARLPLLNVSVDEAADALGIGRTKFYEILAEEGSLLRAVKIGNRTLIVWDSVLAFQENLIAPKKADNDVG